VLRAGGELHMVRPAELLLVEVHHEGLFQLLAVPAIALQELLVGVALLSQLASSDEVK
jgi:hypothetical protein